MKNKALKPPHAKQLQQTETLCTWEKPYAAPANYANLFTQAMTEILIWHQEKSKFYASYLNSLHFDPTRWQGDISKIPFIPADFFKLHEVKSVADSEVSLHLTSSGTTGQKSQIFFDSWSIGCAQQMVDFIFSHYGWIQSAPVNYLLYSYETKQGSKLGTAYTDDFLTKYAPFKDVTYALKWNGKDSHDFDLYGCIQTLQDYAAQGLPVRIFGFPAFFYFTIQRMIDLGLPALKLHPDSLVFLGGGWKGYADKAINRNDFYHLVESKLGIPNHRLRDGFGSVEHCVPYIECKNHRLHVPIYSKVIIRDVYTLAPQPYGKKGFLQFVSPYITSVPAHSVLMGDLAELHQGTECNCGLNTDWFEILGRAGITRNKSCAIAASELLKAFA
jgi:phenylacetate-coenzyme A ligase PaaK-like adenylate-forming protein